MILTNNKFKLAIPALERGLDVLEIASETSLPLTLTAIARSCGRSVTEMQRVVACLNHRGYLFRDTGGGYRITSKLFRMGHACPPFQDLLARSRVPMREFTQRTGEAVHISVLAEDRLLIVANLPGIGYLQLGVNAGSSHDPMISASGKVLLAAMPASDFEGFIKRNKPAAYHLKTLRRRIAGIQRDGYECIESHLFCGVYDLAMGVTMPGDQCVAAVACSWLHPRKSPVRWKSQATQSLLPRLRHCAEQIAANFERASASAREIIS